MRPGSEIRRTGSSGEDSGQIGQAGLDGLMWTGSAGWVNPAGNGWRRVRAVRFNTGFSQMSHRLPYVLDQNIRLLLDIYSNRGFYYDSALEKIILKCPLTTQALVLFTLNPCRIFFSGFMNGFSYLQQI